MGEKITFLEFITSVINLYRNNKWLAIVMATISLIIAGVLYQLPVNYESHFVFKINGVSSEECENHLSNLPLLVEQSSNDRLEQAFGINNEAAESLKEVTYKVTQVEASGMLSSTLVNEVIVNITMYSDNPALFPLYEQSILNHLANTPYFERLEKDQLKTIHALIDEYKASLSDSTTHIIQIGSTEFSSSERTYLKEQISALQMKTSNYSTFQLITPAYVPSKPARGKALKVGGAVLIINLFGLVLIILAESWKRSA